MTLNAANYDDVDTIALVKGGISGSQLTIDNAETTSVTLNSAGGRDAYVDLADDAAVANL